RRRCPPPLPCTTLADLAGHRPDTRQRNPRQRFRTRAAELGRLAGRRGTGLWPAAATPADAVLPVALAARPCRSAPGSATAGLSPAARAPATAQQIGRAHV